MARLIYLAVIIGGLRCPRDGKNASQPGIGGQEAVGPGGCRGRGKHHGPAAGETTVRCTLMCTGWGVQYARTELRIDSWMGYDKLSTYVYGVRRSESDTLALGVAGIKPFVQLVGFQYQAL